MEQGFWGNNSLCLTSYPALSSLVGNPYETSGNVTISLKQIRNHAVDLATDIALADLGAAQHDSQANDLQRISEEAEGEAVLAQFCEIPTALSCY